MLETGSSGSVPISLLTLDLTDATGRAHAAWWLLGKTHLVDTEKHGIRHLDVIWFARSILDGSSTDTEALRRVVLMLAGMEP
jgi:hypothetical protein